MDHLHLGTLSLTATMVQLWGPCIYDSTELRSVSAVEPEAKKCKLGQGRRSTHLTEFSHGFAIDNSTFDRYYISCLNKIVTTCKP